MGKKSYSISDARNNLPALVHDVERGPPVAITRRGEPVAVLISVRDYRGMTAGHPDLWDAIEQFRAEHDLHDLDVDQVYEGVRDANAGREVEL